MTTRRTFITGLLASAVAPAVGFNPNDIVPLADGAVASRYAHSVYQMGFSVAGDYSAQANFFVEAFADNVRFHEQEIERQLVERLFTPGEQPPGPPLPRATLLPHKSQTGAQRALNASDRS